jgi:3D (Asp-Asp-Asp) domain-containing protein
VSVNRLLVVLLLAAAGLAVAPAASADDTAPGRHIVAGTSGTGLLLRAGPGFDQPVLGTVAEGTTVVALAAPTWDGTTDWYPVETEAGNALGYLNGMYLIAAGTPPVAVVEDTPAGPTISAIVTGYAIGADGGRVGSMTASGVRTHWGTVAADVRLYPFGTKLTIEGFDGVVFTVEDTGSAVRGQIFDVWFPDLPAAIAFGTQRRKVTILP